MTWAGRIIGIAAVAVAAQASAQSVITTQNGPVRIAAFATGLVDPWGLTFTPDGRLLVTEKSGRLRVVSAAGAVGPAISGVPAPTADGQGGLLDVAVHPQFATNGLVYLSFSEPGPGGSGTAGTAVARAQLQGNALIGTRVIWRQDKTGSGTLPIAGANHYGGRLRFAPNGLLFVTTGDRALEEPAQDLSVTVGKIVRIRSDGTVPATNPFVGQAGAKPEIWSYGHRNVQSAAIQPSTGRLWTAEHGPSGGDELNIPFARRNYGWPRVSWGNHYDGRDIPNHDTNPAYLQPVKYWPSRIAPGGMTFYDGALFPAWNGNLLLSGMAVGEVVRLTISGNTVTAEERLPIGERIRSLTQGPDGAVYVITDSSNGRVLKLTPG